MEKKNNTINAAAGLITGYGVYALMPKAFNKFRNETLGRILDAPLNAEQISVYKRAGRDLFESKFSADGYSIFDLGSDKYRDFPNKSIEYIEKVCDEKIASSTNFISRFMNKFKKFSLVKANKGKYKQVVDGHNAFYWVRNRAVVINMDKKPVYLFHEFGHAMDYANESLHKSMENLWRNKRINKLFFGSVILTSLLTNPKSKEDLKDAGGGEKFVQFIKRNGGLILGAFLIPSVLEECLANINGQKLAKEFVPKAHMPRVTKSHINSALGYLLQPLVIAGTVYLANKVRDKVAQNIH